ncbi:hypothetical protein VTI28DRAFT_2285 [Corynascus sepedonium]
MSGVEILGAIASAIALVEGASKFYTAIKDTNNLPQAFTEAGQRLPLIRATLGTAEASVKKRSLDAAASKEVKTVIEACRQKAERLHALLEQLVPKPDTSRFQRYRAAIRRLGRENMIEQLVKSMLEDVSLLASNRGVQTSTSAQVDEIKEAIAALAELPPSVPASRKSYAFTHTGSGHQFNNTGDGNQNNNHGSGNQYMAECMNFGAV